MKLKPNIGMINALIRITIGLFLLSWSTAKMVKRPWRDSYLLVAFCAAMKVAEGIVRYCPVTELYQKYTNGDFSSSNGADQITDEQVPYNPT